ncbi:MAG: hypothetical protein DME76_13220 [Verrucomicrobia bacterium]|nr:MAG: hypothetical protein DME76_13220 [Verrucomicrobiota bacterium]
MIGVAADGVTLLGDTANGIVFDATGGVIGGPEPGAANVIAYNGQWGNMLRNHPLRTAHPPARRNKSPLRTADSTAPPSATLC